MNNLRIDFIVQLANKHTAETAVNFFFDFIKQHFGAEHGAYGNLYFNPLKQENASKQPFCITRANDAIYNYYAVSRYSNAFNKEYEQADGFLYDESVIECRRFKEGLTATSNDFYNWNPYLKVEDYACKESYEVDQISYAHGIYHGISLPLYRKSPHVAGAAGISFTDMKKSEYQAYFPGIQDDLIFVVKHFDMYVNHRFSNCEIYGVGDIYTSPVLDSDQELILKMLAKGASKKEAYAACGVTNRYITDEGIKLLKAQLGILEKNSKDSLNELRGLANYLFFI